MTDDQRLLWASAANSHPGTVRKINEDACLELRRIGDNGGLWAVADGMGGHEAGDVASQMVKDALLQIPPPNSLDAFIIGAETALQRVNRLLLHKAAEEYQQRTIGSTVVILLFYKSEAACLWVGDSRIYRLRHNQLKQLTRDHSHVQELLDLGLIDPEAAHNHPMSNVITRAVGSSEDLRIDRFKFELQSGDTFLLCSDGLTKVLSDEEIAKHLVNTPPHYAVRALLNTALRRMADDNVTSVVVALKQRGEADLSGETVPLQKIIAKPTDEDSTDEIDLDGVISPIDDELKQIDDQNEDHHDDARNNNGS